MKKILITINTLGLAGAEVALLGLLGQLDPREYEVDLFVLTGQGELIHRVPEHVKLLNSKYCDSSVLSKEGRRHLTKTVLHALVCKGRMFTLFPYLCRHLFRQLGEGKLRPDKLLWRVLSDGAPRFKEEYDLAIAYLEGGATYYVADHVKAKCKATFLHVDYSQAGYSRSLDRECYLNFDRVFTVSDEVKESFLKVYPECKDRTDVFHNILDQEEIRNKAKLPGGFTDDYKGKRILTVGRLTSQKAYEISIDAMKLLKDKGVAAKWYVLGEGDQRAMLTAKIQQLGLENDFILMGAVDNPYPYYAQTEIYVHATRFEGKSIAIQEAQTLGCATLVSDCSGNREQVTHGVDGLLCDLTPEGICAGIEELLNSEEKCQRYGQAAAAKSLANPEELRKLLDLVK
ncbi:MAG: glycosyltransferase [Lachnospiraceae bacterium]|nr:glycosyltransferase [Lachnospiraceae bacterium]